MKAPTMLYDWNQLYPRITAAIREVDSDTPILIGGMGYSAIEWLPYLQPTGDPRTVYVVHQYAPFQYTHQSPDASDCTYPGWCDLDWDGDDDPSEEENWGSSREKVAPGLCFWAGYREASPELVKCDSPI